MKAIVDFHIHIYPEFELSKFFESFAHYGQRSFPNLENPLKVACLVEREGQRWFQDLAAGRVSLPEGWRFESLEPGQSGALYSVEDRVVFVAGRQIVTQDRFEVLSIGSDVQIPDGGDSKEVIEAIEQSGGIPVLPWAPGKWLFARGKKVASLFENFGPDRLAVGDTSLRPAVYGGGAVFQKVKEAGYCILPGSDPLPCPGEEGLAGCFCAELDLSEMTPAGSIVDAFKSKIALEVSKNRSSIFSVGKRILSHELAKRKK